MIAAPKFATRAVHQHAAHPTASHRCVKFHFDLGGFEDVIGRLFDAGLPNRRHWLIEKLVYARTVEDVQSHRPRLTVSPKQTAVPPSDQLNTGQPE